jgi:tetratricopeptide (TPR) repeat protein
LGALGSRGLDPDHIARRGLAKIVKLGLAAWLEQLSKRPEDPRRNWEHFDSWRAFFGEGTSGQHPSDEYITAALTAPISQHLDIWIESAPIEDLLLWVPPSMPIESIVRSSTVQDVEVWTWVVERFTQTYLERWSLSSLKREYSFIRGSWSPEFPVELLADRIVTREAVTAALADRALLRDDVVDPSTMNSFTEQAVALLADGQRATAAALFDAARALKPQDLTAQNNYAFCILIDRPQEARDLLTDVLARGIDEKTVAWCNIALAESLLGNNSLALDACEKAYEAADGDRKAFLWQQRDGDWVVEETKPRLWIVHMGAELEQSPDVSGGTWAGRLSLLETPETSSDPSSVETSGEDL